MYQQERREKSATSAILEKSISIKKLTFLLKYFRLQLCSQQSSRSWDVEQKPPLETTVGSRVVAKIMFFTYILLIPIQEDTSVCTYTESL